MYTAEEYLDLIKTSVYLGAGMYGNITDYLIEQGHTVDGWKYKVGEHNIYGSSRVGVHRTDLVMIRKLGEEDKEYTQEDLVNFALIRGSRNYELSNHLGNVQVVITDKRIAVCNEELEVSRFEAEVLVATDYYPFGMIMPGRDWTYQECTEGFYDTTYGYDQLSFTFSVQTLTTGQDIELGYTLFPAIPLPVLTQYQSGHSLQEYIDEIVTNGSSVQGFTFTQTDIDEVTFTVDASGGFLDCGDTFIIHAPWQSYYFYATCSDQVKWVQDCKDVGYRYGFNGQEKDDEISGAGNSLSFTFRIYDSRLGRFFSVDPLGSDYPGFAPYLFAQNQPIWAVDWDGLEARIAIAGQGNGTNYEQSHMYAFEARAYKLKQNHSYSMAYANTGTKIINELKNATSKEGSISSAIIFGHGGSNGLYLDVDAGFYTNEMDVSNFNDGAATTNDLRSKITAGDIKFTHDATVILAGCNNGLQTGSENLAENLTKATGVSTIGADDWVVPEYDANGNETGKLTTKYGGHFYKYDQVFTINYFDESGKLLNSYTATSQEQIDGYNKGFNADNKYKSSTSDAIVKTDLGTTIDPSDH